MSNELHVPTIAADRFPVSMLSAQGSVMHPKGRVILTQPDDGRITMWIAPGEVVFDTNYQVEGSVFGSRSQDWFVETDLGQIVIRALGGCGCGDRLKHWTPEQFQPYRIGRPLR